MPFTVSHIAAIVPVAWVSRWRLPFSALAIGAMIPDCAGYYPSLLNYRTTHSMQGVLTHCLPIGVFFYYFYQAFLKQPFFDLFPVDISNRLKPWIDRPTSFALTAICAVFMCVAFGAAGHVFWDSFTRSQAWGVKMFPQLKGAPITISDRRVRWYELIQHGSSLLLLPMAWGAYRWIMKQPVHDEAVDRARVPGGLVFAAAVVLGIGTVVYYVHIRNIYPTLNWLSALTVSAKRACPVAFQLFLVYAVAMNFFWWRERSRPAEIVREPTPPG